MDRVVVTGFKDRWYRIAHIFTLKQRIRELEVAIKHWPDSDKTAARNQELYDKRNELIELENGTR